MPVFIILFWFNLVVLVTSRCFNCTGIVSHQKMLTLFGMVVVMAADVSQPLKRNRTLALSTLAHFEHCVSELKIYIFTLKMRSLALVLYR